MISLFTETDLSHFRFIPYCVQTLGLSLLGFIVQPDVATRRGKPEVDRGDGLASEAWERRGTDRMLVIVRWEKDGKRDERALPE